MEDTKEINHILGHTRTIRTAVMVVEFLRRNAIHHSCDTDECRIHGDMFTYRFKDPTPGNGFWSADIIVRTYKLSSPCLKHSGELVNICRAFVAGSGEIWT